MIFTYIAAILGYVVCFGRSIPPSPLALVLERSLAEVRVDVVSDVIMNERILTVEMPPPISPWLSLLWEGDRHQVHRRNTLTDISQSMQRLSRRGSQER